MSKQSIKETGSKWVYFVNNWGSPIGVFTNVTLAASLFKYFYEKWGNLQEGALSVVRYRPGLVFEEQDITSSILKMVCNG